MKLKKLLFHILLCFLVTSCADESDLNTSPDKDLCNRDCYMSFNIFPTGNLSRATRGTTIVNEDGTEEENAVKDVMFLFFTNNKASNVNPVVVYNPVMHDDRSGNIDEHSDVLILGINNELPNQMLAIVNSSSAGLTANSFYNLTLEQAKSVVINSHSVMSDDNKPTYFVMSNSAFYNNDDMQKPSYATDIPGGSIKKTVAEAKKTNPIKIYVERIAAKIYPTVKLHPFTAAVTRGLDNYSAKAPMTLFDKKSDHELEVVSVTPSVNLLGYKVTNDNNLSYLVKHIPTNNQNNYTGNWNDKDNFRSWWGDSYTPNKYTRYTYNQIKGCFGTSYCFENTSGNSRFIVSGKLILKGNGPSFNSNKYTDNLYRWRGRYYTEDALKIQIAEKINLAGYASSAGTLTYNDIDFVKVNNDTIDYVIPQLVTTSTAVAPNVVNSMLKDVCASNRIYCWNGGKTYYYADVVTYGRNNNSAVGVIRNTLYKININSVNGLGTPVLRPDVPIIPSKIPDLEDSYLSAEIEVLPWEEHNQDISFGN